MTSRSSYFLRLSIAAFSLVAAMSYGSSLALDENFRAPLISRQWPPGRALLLPDGKFVIYFNPDTLTDQRRGAINRYLADGTLDASFNFTRNYEAVQAAVALPNGQLIIAAIQREYGSSTFTEKLLRLNGDGSIDSSFNSPVVQTGTGATVRTVSLQPDGKILVAGYFDSFAGVARSKIVRLMSDGTTDNSFNPPTFTSPNGIWAAPAIQPDGKIVVGGHFTAVNGITSNGVARLNSDGSLDVDFAMTAYRRAINRPIRGIRIQSDGKIVLAGTFQFGSGFSITRAPLVRVNSNGTADSSFITVTNLPYSPSLKDLAVQADGKMLCPVASTVYRFNPDGSVDGSFRQPDFWDWSLHTDPTLRGDTTLISVLPDGRIFVGGAFTDVDSGSQPSFSHYGAVRLDANGNVDATLVQTHRAAISVYPTSFVRLADNTTLAAANIAPATYLQPDVSYDLLHLGSDGAILSGPTLNSTNPKSVLTQRFAARDVTQMADGKLLIRGDVRVQDNNATLIDTFAGAKFLDDGTEDPAYRWSNIYFGKPITLATGGALLSADGTDAQAAVDGVLVSVKASGAINSNFHLDAVIERRSIFRNPDGTLSSFFAGSRVLAVQPDGKLIFIYLGSDEPPYYRHELFHLVRLNADGSLDSSFVETTFQPFDLVQNFPVVFDPYYGYSLQPPEGAWKATPPLYDAQLQPDGKMVIAGRFTSFAGMPARGLVRLNPDGTVDPSFATGSGVQWTQTTETPSFFPIIEQVKTQLDGKLLIAGTFELCNGTALPGIASLNPDGSLDSSFVAPVVRQKYRSGTVKLERQADGSFLLGGPYSFPGEIEPAGLVRINTLGGTPVIGSPTLATAVVNRAFSYQIVASGQPSSFGASGLPPGFSVDAATGLISGTAASEQVGTYTVLLTATNGEGTSKARALTFIVPAPPRLVAAVSQKDYYVKGAYTTFDINLPLTGTPGIECRSDQSGHRLILSFNNDLAGAEATVSAGSGTVSYTSAGSNTMEIGLENVANAQTLTITLRNLTDEYLQAMPDTTISVSFLLGDVNGDRVVNSGDATIVRSRSGQSLNPTNFRADLNIDGSINSGDTTIARTHSGQSVSSASESSRAAATK